MLVGFGELPKGMWLWRASFLGALNIGLFFALLFTAAYRLPGGVVATLMAIQPLLVALLAWLILAEHPCATHLHCRGLRPVRRGTDCPGPSSQV